jgi:hypothetical protein
MTGTHSSTEALKDLLRGFARSSNHAALERMSLYDDWARIAAAELERRATHIVEMLDEDTLRAMAAGEIDFQSACREIARENSAQQSLA